MMLTLSRLWPSGGRLAWVVAVEALSVSRVLTW